MIDQTAEMEAVAVASKQEPQHGLNRRNLSPAEFASAIEVLQVGTGKTLGDRQIEVWYTCLKDLPLKVLRIGISRFLIEGDDWPSISKIRKLATDSRYGPLADHGTAFAEAMSAVAEFGLIRSVAARESLGPTLWRAVQSMGGWKTFCDLTEQSRSTFRAQFRMAYESIASIEQSQRLLPDALRPRIESDGPREALPWAPKGIE